MYPSSASRAAPVSVPASSACKGLPASLFTILCSVALAGCLGGGSGGGDTTPASQSSTAPANISPTIAGSPAGNVQVGASYAFAPQASDPDGDTLTFAISNLPVWASFNTSTGVLSGAPAENHVGATTGIVITVTDGEASTSLAGFTIVVDANADAGTPPASNTAPTIAGTPVSAVNAGTSFVFSPQANDPDSDTLAFSIQNKPEWASFNTATGRLSGTPTAADVGTYVGIVISVSDGDASAELPAFSVAVTQVANGSVTLSWAPPTENTDGSALTNLRGYSIHYGTDESSLTEEVSIDNPGIASYVVDNLSPATWYFAIKSISANGIASDFSAVVSKTIQ